MYSWREWITWKTYTQCMLWLLCSSKIVSSSWCGKVGTTTQTRGHHLAWVPTMRWRDKHSAVDYLQRPGSLLTIFRNVDCASRESQTEQSLSPLLRAHSVYLSASHVSPPHCPLNASNSTQHKPWLEPWFSQEHPMIVLENNITIQGIKAHSSGALSLAHHFPLNVYLQVFRIFCLSFYRYL